MNDKGYWTDSSNFFYEGYAISAPNWADALSSRERLPKTAKVGVRLKLVAKAGAGSIASCTVVMPSKDARLDAAACKALAASSYTLRSGRMFDGPSDFPVLVEWHGDDAVMTAPILPTVPHMPKDMPLLPKDRPDGDPHAFGTIPIQIKLDDNGVPIGCTVMESTANDAWDAAACRATLKRAHFTASLDNFGRPATGLYEAVADWNAMVVRPAR